MSDKSKKTKLSRTFSGLVSSRRGTAGKDSVKQRGISPLAKREVATTPEKQEPLKPQPSIKPREDLVGVLAPPEHLYEILSNIPSAHYFQRFVARKFSSETLSFWVAVEHYQQKVWDNEAVAIGYAKDIHDIYLKRFSEKEVNLEGEQSYIDIDSPSVHTFERLQNLAWLLLVNSDYQKFITSPDYKEYLEGRPLPQLKRTVTIDRLDEIIQRGLFFTLPERPSDASKKGKVDLNKKEEIKLEKEEIKEVQEKDDEATLDDTGDDSAMFAEITRVMNESEPDALDKCLDELSEEKNHSESVSDEKNDDVINEILEDDRMMAEEEYIPLSGDECSEGDSEINEDTLNDEEINTIVEEKIIEEEEFVELSVEEAEEHTSEEVAEIRKSAEEEYIELSVSEEHIDEIEEELENEKIEEEDNKENGKLVEEVQIEDKKEEENNNEKEGYRHDTKEYTQNNIVLPKSSPTPLPGTDWSETDSKMAALLARRDALLKAHLKQKVPNNN